LNAQTFQNASNFKLIVGGDCAADCHFSLPALKGLPALLNQKTRLRTY